MNRHHLLRLCTALTGFATLLVSSAKRVDVAVSNEVVNPEVSRRIMGCHSDPGFAQTTRGFVANLLYAPAFDRGLMKIPAWQPRQTPGADARIRMDPARSFAAHSAMDISIPGENPGSVEAAVVNRGIGGVGFALQGGKDYTVEVWVWQSSSATGFVELRDHTANATLARQEFAITATGPLYGATWRRVALSLTPSASTTCEGIPFGSDPSIDCGLPHGSPEMRRVCVRCGGELLIGLRGPGRTALGYASLRPGAWGLLHDTAGRPLPVLASGAAVLQEMGVSVIRSGGTVSQSLRWKDWRGPMWNRPSSQATWGQSHLAEWGPFEVAEMAEALGIDAVVTLAYESNSAQDWADLVEYCWGDATTYWGRLRMADRGHAAPFRLSVFELGNEQYNPDFLEQVAAMERRAAAPGVQEAPALRYLFPENGGLVPGDAARALEMGLPADRILTDLHVAAGGGVREARRLFSRPPAPSFEQGAACLETNAKTHDLKRALDEAADLLEWINAPPDLASHLWGRTASFCSGTQTQFDHWDQGISSFLPNATWLQPPGHVHAGLAATWAPAVLSHSFQGSARLPFSAQADPGQRRLVLRAVNPDSLAASLHVSLTEESPESPGHVAGLWLAANSTLSLWILSGGDLSWDNTPGNPARVAPASYQVPVDDITHAFSFNLPARSFVIAEAELQGEELIRAGVDDG